MAVPITGKWTLFYDWNSDGSYSSTSMEVKPGGTWSNGEGHNGYWTQEAGMFMFHFKGSETTYAGNWASKSITGIMTTFRASSLEGSFYMLKTGVPTSFKALRVPEKASSSGK